MLGVKTTSIYNHIYIYLIVFLSQALLERIEAADFSEEDVEDGMVDHVRRWVDDCGLYQSPECLFAKPLTPSASEDVNLGYASRDLVHTQDATTSMCKASSGDTGVVVTTEHHVQPSTSGVTASSKPVSSRKISEGSELDSDFDDEFDVAPIERTTFTGLRRDIPDDDELEGPTQNVIVNIERGMDDEADRLLGLSSNFTWVEGFDTFRGVPETFSGPTPGPVKTYESAYDAFVDIFDNDIMELMARETNRFAKQKIDEMKQSETMKPHSRMHDWTETDVDEIYVLLGVFMFMGIDPRTSMREYWSSGNYLELSRFRTMMSYSRYVLLNKFLHFVDNSDVSQNCQPNVEISSTLPMSRKLFKLSPIIAHLQKKFDCLYNLGRNISIDESLTLFKGRLSWVQTIRSKAARFGIKSYELCESCTGYMARFQIYTGKSDDTVSSDPAVSIELGGKSTKVVLELLKGIDGRGHCLTMDNFYNCPSLARYLKTKGFDCLGTLRPCRRNVPYDIAKVPKNVPKGTIIARQCGDVSIITWKDSKLVNMISTFHDDSTFVGSKAGRTLVKPICVRDYNNTMGGIDLKDQKLSMYLLERKRGLKWYVKIFKRLLNVSILNAYVMYSESLRRRGESAMTHREFRYDLAKSLVDRHRSSEISRPVGELMRLRRDIVHVPKYLSGSGNRKRCKICMGIGKHKLVNSHCYTCGVGLCFEECWEKWHSATTLELEAKRGRKRRRDE